MCAEPNIREMHDCKCEHEANQVQLNSKHPSRPRAAALAGALRLVMC